MTKEQREQEVKKLQARCEEIRNRPERCPTDQMTKVLEADLVEREIQKLSGVSHPKGISLRSL